MFLLGVVRWNCHGQGSWLMDQYALDRLDTQVVSLCNDSLGSTGEKIVIDDIIILNIRYFRPPSNH